MSSKIRIAAAALALLAAGCASYPAEQMCADARLIVEICNATDLAGDAIPPTPPGVVAEDARDLTCLAARAIVARCDAAGKRVPEEQSITLTPLPRSRTWIKDDSVSLLGVAPQVFFGLHVAELALAERGVDLVLTAGVEGRHAWASLHYAGMAVDFRARDLPEADRAVVAAEISAALGQDFDVIAEADPPHFHLEWQPKRRDPAGIFSTASPVCGYGSPARNAACVRAGVQICGSIRPQGILGGLIPPHSDSTCELATTTPSLINGCELFVDAMVVCPDVGACRVINATNDGWQLRSFADPSGRIPGQPFRSFGVFYAAGHPRSYFVGQSGASENQIFGDAVAGRYLADGRLIIADPKRQGVGLSLWVVSPQPNEVVTQLYQDDSAAGRSRSASIHGDHVLACGLAGCRVYSIPAALAAGGCLETSGACPGVDLGAVTGSSAAFAAAKNHAAEVLAATSLARDPLWTGAIWSRLDAPARDAETTANLLLSGALTAASVEHGGCTYLAAATSYSVELWRLCDLGNPGSAQHLHGGLASPDARAVVLWTTEIEEESNARYKTTERRPADSKVPVRAKSRLRLDRGQFGPMRPGYLLRMPEPGPGTQGRLRQVRADARGSATDAAALSPAAAVSARSASGLWLATVEWQPGQRWLRIRDISTCAGGCSSLPAPVAEVNVSGTPASVLDLLTYSKAGDVELVCYGLEEGGDLRGLGRGRCWRVDDPSSPVEIGAEGGTYAGGCNGEQVDAGGDSQSANGHGVRNFQPRIKRAYLIDGKIVILRAAYGQLDALVYTPLPVDPAVVFADDFETGNIARWR